MILGSEVLIDDVVVIRSDRNCPKEDTFCNFYDKNLYESSMKDDEFKCITCREILQKSAFMLVDFGKVLRNRKTSS